MTHHLRDMGMARPRLPTSGVWGSLYSPNDIVRRYVEREENWSPPANNHLTQVLWRSTKYVGCAEASKSMGGNKMCNTSVVSYLHPPLDLLSHSQHVLLLLIFFVSHEVRV